MKIYAYAANVSNLCRIMLYLGTTQLSWSNEVLNQVIPGWDNERPQRPDFLNLNAERKPHFQFVAAPYTVREETGTM